VLQISVVFQVIFALGTGVVDFARVRLNDAFFECCGFSFVDAANYSSLIQGLLVLDTNVSTDGMLLHCVSCLYRLLQEC